MGAWVWMGSGNLNLGDDAVLDHRPPKVFLWEIRFWDDQGLVGAWISRRLTPMQLDEIPQGTVSVA